MLVGTELSSASSFILVVLATQDIPGVEAHEPSEVPEAHS